MASWLQAKVKGNWIEAGKCEKHWLDIEQLCFSLTCTCTKAPLHSWIDIWSFFHGSYFQPSCNFLYLNGLKLGRNCSSPQLQTWTAGLKLDSFCRFLRRVYKANIFLLIIRNWIHTATAGHILAVRCVVIHVIELNTLWGLLNTSISQDVKF